MKIGPFLRLIFVAEHRDAQLNSEEEVRLPEGIFGQNLTETSSKDGNLLTLEVQIDRKNVLDSDHGKVGERFEKVHFKPKISDCGYVCLRCIFVEVVDYR